MNLRGFLFGLVCLALLCSFGCRNKNTAVSSDPPEAGAIYSLNDGEGGFRAAKVLAIENEIIFVNLYTERWLERPSLEATKKISVPVGVAYSMQSFADMQPARLQAGNVSSDELEAFEEWKQSKRDVF
jgi:hypothetical protein